MKKFKIKHVALVAMLAGYSVSSVFAAEKVSTTSAAYIKGHAPILKASDADLTDPMKADVRSMYMTVRTSAYDGTNDAATEPVRADKKLKVGDWLVLRYILTDADGDPEGEGFNTNKNIKFFYKTSEAGAWIAFPSSQELNLVQGSTGGSATYSEYAIKVPADVTGAGLIGYKVIEKTQFGVPAGDLWYRVPDAFVQETSLGKGDQTEPGDAGLKDPDSGGNTTLDTPIKVCFEDPITCKPGEGGTVATNFEIAIYKIDASGQGLLDYAAPGTTVNPIVGEEFIAIIMDDKVAIPDSDYTKFDDFEWYLTGTNTSAVPTPDDVAAPSALVIGTAANRQYTIEVNADIQAKFPAPLEAKAGAQGFNLSVRTELK